jgi:hypothetical protein
VLDFAGPIAFGEEIEHSWYIFHKLYAKSSRVSQLRCFCGSGRTLVDGVDARKTSDSELRESNLRNESGRFKLTLHTIIHPETKIIQLIRSIAFPSSVLACGIHHDTSNLVWAY